MKSILQFDCHHRYPSGFELNARFQTDALITALVGPSGSGKSTILGILAGDLHPQRGRIQLGTKCFFDSQQPLLIPPEQRDVGWLPQDQCLFPHLRVRRNLEYGRLRKHPDRTLLAQCLEHLEIEPLLERWPNTLSGGQSQRVALARAILSKPALLLLDEPLLSVEPTLRERCAAFIRHFAEQTRTPVLLVSHDEQLVNLLTSQRRYINHGKVNASNTKASAP